MLRFSFKGLPVHRGIVLYNLQKEVKHVRHLSSVGGAGRGKKLGLAVVGAAILSTGGAVVYAQNNPDFRKLLKDNLPFTDAIFTYIPDWGEKKSPKTKEEKQQEASLIRIKQEREKRQKLEKPSENVGSPTPTPPPLPPPPPTAPVTKKGSSEELVTAKQDSEVEAKTKNAALVKNLKESKSTLEGLCQDASVAQQIAIDAVKEHSQLLFKALDHNEDSNDENLWSEVRLAQEAKLNSLTRATETLIDLRSALDRVQGHIAQGKSNKMTANNGELLGAEEDYQRVSRELKNMEEQLASAQTESQAAALYKELLENGKEQLQKELEAILPPDFKGRKLNDEELNLMLGHAHKSLAQLHRQLAKQEATEQLRVRLAIDEMRSEQESKLNQKIRDELGKQKNNFEIQQQNKEVKDREVFELEMRKQLRRQAAAHSDHLQEALSIREVELDRQNGLRCQESLLKQQGDHQEQVGHSMARLKGIQHYLQAREELEKASRKAQQLWLACQALRQTVRFGITGRDTSETVLHPLKGQVLAIREATVNIDDPLYATVIGSIPETALERGVYTEEALRKRFTKVESTCRRLAMLEDENQSAPITLYAYALSYIRSLLVIDSWSGSVADSQLDSELLGRAVVEPGKWKTKDILCRTRACLDRRELEQALRYCSQLKGEPARAAQDWLTEARLALETRQAADALMAEAASITVQAYH